MKSVLIRLQEYYNQACPAEKEVIKLILASPGAVVKYSIHELSEKKQITKSLKKLKRKTRWKSM